MANVGLSPDHRDPNTYIERAKSLVNRFNATPLHVVEVQKEYDEKISGFAEGGSLGSSSSRQKPSDTALELDAQLVSTALYRYSKAIRLTTYGLLGGRRHSSGSSNSTI